MTPRDCEIEIPALPDPARMTPRTVPCDFAIVAVFYPTPHTPPTPPSVGSGGEWEVAREAGQPRPR
eukprot:CAMPEP_0118979246 /NCGR_PEP_ID=MMETSP1173-20130426/25508_1 /TAXON_ID=1034831 /ORGANISM="Rhizochromulina marina cf, Strain CCMP1243" /LENGTH=65 /DNA_ID=CAMNT_0006929497 /DNA_START=145 /DNA_END=342 /DNA_ORIENTATION=-